MPQYKYLKKYIPVGLIVLLILILYWSKTKPPETCAVYVYTYSSFASSTGVGGDLQALFQEQTNCQLHLENIGDARTLLQRLNTEIKIKGTTDADVVLGLDQFSISQAYNILQWEKIPWYPHTRLSQRFQAIKFSQEYNTFLPFDWSPLTFIYRPSNKLSTIQTPQDILTYDIKYALMDPRSSSPGFQFLVWILNQFGQNTLSQFIQKAYLLSPSWTVMYGLFTKKQTDIAFSYLTSLAYHRIEENNHTLKVMEFHSGHPYQIEFAGVVADSPRKPMALKFLKFLHSQPVQKLIMTKNYMFPVIANVEEGTAFADLPNLSLIPHHTLQKPESFYLKNWKRSLEGLHDFY